MAFIADQIKTEYFKEHDSIEVLATYPEKGKRLLKRTYFVDGEIVTRFKVTKLSPAMASLRGANCIATFGLESDCLEWAINVYNQI